uniref:Uncharacterized protein n=1 Tax=Florenciella parvula TaxID=236787 RepID=A0A7S2GB48_9STRA|mmetsp:Transcript_6758/g.13899  ORF Transcript_6758/g.13899 Transcript_6758/m.13899 type:complete len:201 (+) Transcript_6758:80-682(+)|eukprot:CAMPEP_0182536436 /NCGR_PEP_ID=MMETSP1323-20130603/19996_1 /TAXON_ID=236787 /ORGANISM="Florenciella parvula, Strain RCC1693" /LENGTH=200 /DNA_ID=CAMNT_0024746673 /DNA_START=80 /DNA_END=682 /DNA_ORIENTATION=+
MGLFRQPPTEVLTFDPLSLRSSMIYHRTYHHSLALHVNHLVFLNTYLFGILVLVCALNRGSFGAVYFVAIGYSAYSVALTEAYAVPYAGVIFALGLGAWRLTTALNSNEIAGLAGAGIVLCSFAAQLVGHAKYELYAAPPHLFHGFVAAPVLEFMSLVLRLGLLPQLKRDVDAEVARARGAAAGPMKPPGHVGSRTASDG